MGLNIISNFAANRALTNLGFSSDAASLSVAKLSSGSRIVTAADDAAALAIGSRLKAEVVSLEQAVVNAGQATSLLQIADGALARTQDILTRLRALSVQAGSQNLADSERALLDVEFQNLLSEVDRIAADTEFNGQKLLTNQNGQFVNTAGNTGLFSEDGSTVLNATFRNFNNDASNSGGDGEFQYTVGVGTVADTAGDTVYQVELSGNAAAVANGAFSATQSIDKGLTENEGGATADLTTGTTLLFQLSGATFQAGTGLTDFTQDNAEVVLTLGESLDLTAFNAAVAATGQGTVSANTNNLQADFRSNQAVGDFTFKVGTGILAEDNVDVSLFGSTVENLGLSNLDILTAEGADATNEAVQQAIDFLVKGRSQAGSGFSRIEFASRNVQTTIENTEAARSTLLDLDVAREITNFTSQQILVQAGISVLAQANQLPQNLLRLFA